MGDMSIVEQVATIIGRARPFLDTPQQVAERVVAALNAVAAPASDTATAETADAEMAAADAARTRVFAERYPGVALSDDALLAVFWDAITGHSDGSGKPKATPREGVAAVRSAVIAALAAAGGTPEALGRVGFVAFRDVQSSEEREEIWEQDVGPRVRQQWAQMAQAVAACAAAAVREREVAPLMALLVRAKRRLRSFDPETPMSEGQARRWYATTEALLAEIAAALGGRADG